MGYAPVTVTLFYFSCGIAAGVSESSSTWTCTEGAKSAPFVEEAGKVAFLPRTRCTGPSSASIASRSLGGSGWLLAWHHVQFMRNFADKFLSAPGPCFLRASCPQQVVCGPKLCTRRGRHRGRTSCAVCTVSFLPGPEYGQSHRRRTCACTASAAWRVESCVQPTCGFANIALFLITIGSRGSRSLVVFAALCPSVACTDTAVRGANAGPRRR